MIVLIVFVFAIVFDNAVADHFDRLTYANASQAEVGGMKEASKWGCSNEVQEIEAIQDLWRPQNA